MRHRMPEIAGVAAAVITAVALGWALSPEEARTMDSSVTPDNSAMPAEGDGNFETAMFGAGCFWGVEAAFRRVEGVVETAVGYSGGHTENPTYREVCSGETGHAEVVQVKFDPEKVAYEALLDVFWKNHDPTQLYRQGPDVGYQYRSVIFYRSPEQEKAARESKRALEKSGKYGRPIVTEIEPARTFWRAEEYHQQYLEKRGAATCHIGLK